MNWKRLVIGILVIILLAAGGFWAYNQFLAPASETDQNGPVTDQPPVEEAANNVVSAEGQVVPLEDTLLAFQLGGEVQEILVAEGESVTAGQPLIQLDTTDQDLAVQQAEAAVVQAEANVQSAEAGLQAAEAGLLAAQADLVTAQAQYNQLKSGATPEQIAAAESNVAIAQAGVTQAAGQLGVVVEEASSAAVKAAQARLTAAQAEYDNALKTYQPIVQNEDADAVDREQAQLQINAALAKLNAAQAALEDVLSGASADERNAASGAVSVAQRQEESAEANLQLLLAGAREEELTVALSQVSQAENGVAEARLRVEAAETAVAQAKAAVAEAEAGLAAAQSAVAKQTLKAPFAGTVANIALKVGEIASPGIPVLTLADFSEWQIETTDLTELSVVAIGQDLPVEISIDAFPGETLTGHIVDIASTADVVRGDVTYVTTIAFDDDKGLPLRWGMTTFVTVDTEQ